MLKWKDKVALVTGATSGIGWAVAQKLAREGMQVIGCGRRAERLQQLEKNIDAQGFRFKGLLCDLQKEEDILSMFEQIQNLFGGVDVLVNNAGLGHIAPMMSGATQYWREMLNVNVLALSICTREAISQMQAKGDEGYIIHISSMSAHRVPAGSAMYAATKFAVRALTEALRQELREAESHIRVSALSPGFVETEFAEQYAKSKERAQQVYSQFKVLEAADIAEQICFLLSTPSHIQIHDILTRPTAQPS